MYMMNRCVFRKIAIDPQSWIKTEDAKMTWRGWQMWRCAALIAAMALAAGLAAAEPVTTGTQVAKSEAKRPPMSRPVTQAIAIGEQAPDFKALTFDGDEIALKDCRGKYLLLTFWASWCGWCVVDTPPLKALHDEFAKDKRIVFVSLSLDSNMDRGEKFVKARDLKWTQGFLGDWAKDQVSLKYKVKEIPLMFLIDPQGKIIDKDDKAAHLRASIAKALAEAPEKK